MRVTFEGHAEVNGAKTGKNKRKARPGEAMGIFGRFIRPPRPEQ